MADARVQSGSANGSSTGPSLTLGGAPAQGNILVAGVVTDVARTQTPAAGWNQIAGNGNHSAYWKQAGAGESASQAPCTLSASTNWAIVMAEYSGQVASSPLL